MLDLNRRAMRAMCAALALLVVALAVASAVDIILTASK